MSPSRPRGSPRLGVHLSIVCAFSLVVALWRVTTGDPITDAIEARLLDLRFETRGPVASPSSVIVVAIDDRVVGGLGWVPPPRGAIAEAVKRLLDAQPAAVGLDLLLLDQTAAGPTLAAAIAGDGRVVLAAAVTGSDESSPAALSPEIQAALERSVISVVVDGPDDAGANSAPQLLLPRPEIVAGATLSHANIVLSDDRVARRIPLGLWIGGTAFLPAMPLEIARIATGLPRGNIALSPGRFLMFGNRRIHTDKAGSVILNHYGGREAITTISLADVLDGRADPALFRNRAVIVGATSESLGDLFATPYSAAVPGAEILATLTANMIADELILRDPMVGALGVALALFLAALLFAASLPRTPAFALATGAAVWLAAIGGVQFAFVEWRLWLDATTMIATLIFTTVWMGAQRFRVERRLKTAMTMERANLANYVSPALAEQLARGLIHDLDSRNQDAAVMFVDVAGYTKLSEPLAPSDSAAFLRELHRLFERCADSHGGVITAFVGDGAMIVFGLPQPGPADAAAAIACGRMLLYEANQFASPATRGQPVALRVSIHFGPVTSAILGGERQAQVTVTGDTVNVASRLQEIAKTLGTSFVISRSLYDAALRHDEESGAGFECSPDQPVRGRGRRIDVFLLRLEGNAPGDIRCSP